jgi:LysM repeat protein
MRARLALLIIPLLVATLACGLSSDDSDNATDAPTQGVIGQNPTTVQVIATSSPQPTVTTAPTLIPTPTCSVRTDWPTVTVAQGETLFTIAQRVGSSVTELTAANCLANANTIQSGQQLRVPAAIPPTVSAGSTTGGTGTGTTGGTGTGGNVPTSCPGSYFFTYNTNVLDTRCPGSVVSGSAAGQDFEGGRVLWYQAAGVYSQPQLYVIYNDGTWAQYTDSWNSSQPFDDPSIIPPAGRFTPVAGIGKMWREAPGVRVKLGWAYAPEQPFTGRRQEPILPANSSVYDLYIDHGVRGLVLQLRRQLVGSAQTWIVAGGYN